MLAAARSDIPNANPAIHVPACQRCPIKMNQKAKSKKAMKMVRRVVEEGQVIDGRVAKDASQSGALLEVPQLDRPIVTPGHLANHRVVSATAQAINRQRSYNDAGLLGKVGGRHLAKVSAQRMSQSRRLGRPNARRVVARRPEDPLVTATELDTRDTLGAPGKGGLGGPEGIKESNAVVRAAAREQLSGRTARDRVNVALVDRLGGNVEGDKVSRRGPRPTI